MRGTWPSSGLCLWVLSGAFMTHTHRPPSNPRPPERLTGLFSCQCDQCPSSWAPTRSSCSILSIHTPMEPNLPKGSPWCPQQQPYTPGPALPWQVCVSRAGPRGGCPALQTIGSKRTPLQRRGCQGGPRWVCCLPPPQTIQLWPQTCPANRSSQRVVAPCLGPSYVLSTHMSMTIRWPPNLPTP